MKLIAYKTADNPNSKVKGHLPDDYITEFMEVQPGQQPPANEGWNILPEDQFQKLLASNNTQNRIDEFNKTKFENSLIPLDRIKGGR